MADTTNTNSDSATIASLQAKLQADTKALQDLQGQLVTAQTNLNTAQTDLVNVNNQYADVFSRAGILQRAGKWGGTKVGSEHNIPGNAGEYYYVSPNDSQIWANTAGFNVLKQQYADGAQKQRDATTAVTAAQTVINNLQSADGKTGAIPTANQHVNDDLNNIANFVPTTTQGQADHAQAVQAAVQIASSNATTSQANATTSQSNAKIADAAVQASTSTTQMVGYIVGGIIVLGLIIFGIYKATRKKS